MFKVSIGLVILLVSWMACAQNIGNSTRLVISKRSPLLLDVSDRTNETNAQSGDQEGVAANSSSSSYKWLHGQQISENATGSSIGVDLTNQSKLYVSFVYSF
jgi:hypothetical protein